MKFLQFFSDVDYVMIFNDPELGINHYMTKPKRTTNQSMVFHDTLIEIKTPFDKKNRKKLVLGKQDVCTGYRFFGQLLN